MLALALIAEGNKAGGVANSADTATRHAPRKSTEPHEPSNLATHDSLYQNRENGSVDLLIDARGDWTHL